MKVHQMFLGGGFGRRATVEASVDAAQKAGHAVIAYGKFLNALINLLIVGFVIFMLVKQITRFRRLYERDAAAAAAEESPAGPPEDVRLLMEIRDLLARRPQV